MFDQSGHNFFIFCKHKNYFVIIFFETKKIIPKPFQEKIKNFVFAFAKTKLRHRLRNMVAINRSIHFSCKEQHIQATIGTKVPETIDTKMPDAFLIPINDTPGKRVFVSKNVPQHSSNGIVAVSKLEHIFHRLPRGEHAMIARTTSGFAIADSRKPTVSEETVAYKARPTACQQVTRREQCSHRGRIY